MGAPGRPGRCCAPERRRDSVGTVSYTHLDVYKRQSHDSVKMRRKAVELSIPCLTAIDTAQVLVKCLRSGKTLADVDLVDISTI